MTENHTGRLRFKKVYIEITNVCNLRCRMCAGTRRAAAFMSPALFDSALAQLEGLAVHLYLHVVGEPLLHPELGELLRLAARRGFVVNLVTNGTLIARRAELLWAAPALRQVHFSVHSQWESPGAPPHAAYFSDLFRFADGAAGRVLISYRIWTAGGARQDAAVHEILSHYGLPDAAFPPPEGLRGLTLAPGAFLNRDRPFVWPSPERIHPSLPPIPKRCFALRDQLAVLADGTVTPCCLDSEGALALGNLAHTPLAEILESPRALRIAEGFAHGVACEPLCATCGFDRPGRPPSF